MGEKKQYTKYRKVRDKSQYKHHHTNRQYSLVWQKSSTSQPKPVKHKIVQNGLIYSIAQSGVSRALLRPTGLLPN